MSPHENSVGPYSQRELFSALHATEGSSVVHAVMMMMVANVTYLYVHRSLSPTNPTRIEKLKNLPVGEV